MDFLYPNMIKMNCRPANLCGHSKGVSARKEENAVKIGSASSYALIENGDIVHSYRRISKNRKDYEKTCENYREGTDTSPFLFHGVAMTAALCGVLWIYPESFRSRGLLIWPVYVNFDLDESESGEYAKQAAMACGKALLVNPLSKDPLSRGGAFFFENGKVKQSLGLDKEGVLVVEV